MRPIRKIQGGIRLQREIIETARFVVGELKVESLAYFDGIEDIDGAVDADERLAVPYIMGVYLEVVADFLHAALENLTKVEDVAQERARELVEELRAETRDNDEITGDDKGSNEDA